METTSSGTWPDVIGDKTRFNLEAEREEVPTAELKLLLQRSFYNTFNIHPSFSVKSLT